MQNLLRVAGYARISHDEDKESYESIVNQKNIMSDYAKTHFGVSHVTLFEDDNFSGYTFNRPAFTQLRQALEAGQFDVVLAKDLSRFGRHNARTLIFLEEMQGLSVRVIAINDAVDTQDEHSDLTLGVKTWYNELYVKDISKKIKSTIANKQKNATWMCAVPYGYIMTDYKKQLFEPDPVAAQVVKRIFSLYLQGWGYKKIANHLTDENIPTPRMREKMLKEAQGEVYRKAVKPQWSIITISEILHNDFYTGVLRTGKYARKSINGKDVKKDEAAHHVFENFHPPIIDKAVFESAVEQGKQRKNSHYRGTKKKVHPYAGLVYCGDCGSPMFAVSNTKRPEGYLCGTYHRRGLKGCTAHHTAESLLNDLVRQYLASVKENSGELLKKLDDALKAQGKDKGTDGHVLEVLERELEQCKAEQKALKMQRIREAMKAPDNAAAIDELYEELEAELMHKAQGLKSQLEHARLAKEQRGQLDAVAQDAVSIMNRLLEKGTFSREDLHYVLERVTVHKDHVMVKLKADIDTLLAYNIDSEGDPSQTTLEAMDGFVFSLHSMVKRCAIS